MVTVADIVSVGKLSLTSVWQPDPTPPVRWVAATELADPTPFLEGGELLLTTGLGTAEWTDEWDAYVARLAARGTVALGLGTGLTHQEIPPQATEACRRHGVALLEVPRDTGFVAVSRCVADMLGKEERLSERDMLASQRARGGLVAALAALDARIGVGEPLPVAAIPRSFENAGFALNETSDEIPVVTWERLVGHGALAVLDRPRAEAFARSFLQPLDDSQRATLHAFVKHHGSRARVASDLGLHRNTVRSRLDEIETALGRSLDDPQARNSAWIALQLVKGDRSGRACTSY